MQQEAFANIEDFGAPDLVAAPGKPARPGQGAPYARYELARAYDEMFESDGTVRPPYTALDSRLSTLSLEELSRRQQACEQSFLHQGITFTVYNDNRATERIIPTDLLPRIVTAAEWARIEAGLTQRIMALNLFLRDIYSDGRVLKDGVVPRSMIFGPKHYRREMRGLPVPHGAYADVPSTRGTYKGGADSELSIAVSLEPTAAPVRHEDFLKVARPMAAQTPTPSMPERLYHQQQQQQQ